MITWIYEKSYDELSEKAADVFCRVVKEKPDAVFGLATGGTPVGLYRVLRERAAAGKVDFSRAVSVNLDEYVGLSEAHPQSYHAFMQKQLFDGVPFSASYLPDGTAADPEQEARRYSALLEQIGTRDLQLLGIGYNGHIGFCEPADFLNAKTYAVSLSDSTIKANARFFDSVEEVPQKAVSMGVQQIFDSKEILLLADRSKHEILHKALEGPITTRVPASLLQLHPRVTVMEVTL